jgi:hypothetical protein
MLDIARELASPILSSTSKNTPNVFESCWTLDVHVMPPRRRQFVDWIRREEWKRQFGAQRM